MFFFTLGASTANLVYSSDDDEEEINLWHENQLERKEYVTQKINEYIATFTVHGLTKMFTGSKIEKVFWCIMLSFGIGASAYIIYGLIVKFLKHDVYTDIREVITYKNVFPSLTFCESTLIMQAYFSYCGVPQGVPRNDLNAVCRRNFRVPRRKPIIEANKSWSNQLFSVSKCKTKEGKSCLNNNHLKSLTHFRDACFVWNYKGQLYDQYSHVDLEFQFFKPKHLRAIPIIIALPHHHDFHEIDITNKIDLVPKKFYQIRLEKTIVKRLPSPFPSNCTNEKTGDIFPGIYNRRSCIESQNFIEMFKKCGDIFDYIRQFIPNDVIVKYGRNRPIREVSKCLTGYGLSETKKSLKCAFPCYELSLKTYSSYREKYNHQDVNDTFHVTIVHEKVDSYKIMEEKELYPLNQMAAGMGGLVSLIIGTSVMSIVEILAYVVLSVYKWTI